MSNHLEKRAVHACSGCNRWRRNSVSGGAGVDGCPAECRPDRPQEEPDGVQAEPIDDPWRRDPRSSSARQAPLPLGSARNRNACKREEQIRGTQVMLDRFQQDRENLSVHEAHGGHEEQHRDVASGFVGGMYRSEGSAESVLRSHRSLTPRSKPLRIPTHGPDPCTRSTRTHSDERPLC